MEAELLRRLFVQMLRIRLVEEGIAEHYPAQQMRCPVHLCIGQEAVAVGVCAHLRPQDLVMSGHRSHGHYLAKGGDLKAMLAELHGKVTGCCGGKGGSMHLIDLKAGFLGATPIVASTIPIAVGAAWGSRLRGEDRVVVVFFGEAATEEGVFHEALNFAALKRLPVVFVCENNLYSVYSPLSVRQPPGREVFQLARGHGVEAHQGDGNDLLTVYDLAGGAIRRTRDGRGPVFLEFKTYRWREHCGPNYDNDLGYRTHEEFQSWVERCPIRRLETHLVQEGICQQSELDRIRMEIEAEFADALRFAQESPFPPATALLEHVYAEAKGCP
ncbi:MAG: thiamine pyrophosphate-dependent dehydrogenase E1 component subunit alpha [Gemmataceae bacterium]|nr:thiamine pyrophosphate-dependent dehydrogenase E1 component subunit alpha [Gemmataceae bacterium]